MEVLLWIAVGVLIPICVVLVALAGGGPAEVFGLIFLWVQKRYGFPRNVRTGREGLVGLTAMVIKAFEIDDKGQYKGKVSVRGELWNARLEEASRTRQPSTVRVRDVDGLTLIVSPTDEPS